MSMWKVNIEEKKTVKSAKDLVYEQCVLLADITGKKIIARVTEYEGEYKSHPERVISDSFTKALTMTTRIPGFDVQNVLGEKASEKDNQFVYELYITSEKTPKYKYRAFIMHYGIALYPVRIIMEGEIAEELELNTEIEVTSESEFLEILGRILGSKRISFVVEKLLSLNN